MSTQKAKAAADDRNVKQQHDKKAEAAAVDLGRLGRVPFSQGALDLQKTPRMQTINARFAGLCELICNKVLIDDLLNKGGIDSDFLIQRITAQALNEDAIIGTHILDVSSTVNVLVATFFEIYPDNIFTIKEQWSLVKTGKDAIPEINTALLKEKFGALKVGVTLKFAILTKLQSSLGGHSFLIKKVSADTFIFFNPNEGEYRNLSINQLIGKIKEQVDVWKGTDIFFTTREAYLKRLQDTDIKAIARKILPDPKVQAALDKTAKEEAPLNAFYKQKKITGKEPIQVNVEQLELKELGALDETTIVGKEDFREPVPVSPRIVAQYIIDQINKRIQEKEKDNGLPPKERRAVFLICERNPGQVYYNKKVDNSPNGKFWMGIILQALRDQGHIFSFKERLGHGYEIQA